MPIFDISKPFRVIRIFTLLVLMVGVSACASQNTDISRTETDDPYEKQNRKVHAFNRGLDKALLKPISNVYGTAVPPDIQESVGNFSTNLGRPGQVVNNVLQGDLNNAANNSVGFLLNTVIGLGGLFDPASELGIPHEPTGFGETLHVWGVKEGAYLELPFFGPSTTRDTTGLAVDILLDPVTLALSRSERYIVTGASAAKGLGARHKYSAMVDSILYESADSYTQARSIYLQNRRFELNDGNTEGTEAYEDPYDDF